MDQLQTVSIYSRIFFDFFFCIMHVRTVRNRRCAFGDGGYDSSSSNSSSSSSISSNSSSSSSSRSSNSSNSSSVPKAFL